LGVKTAKDNFAPRVGVSYRINEQTVVRGGYGMSVIPFPDNQYAYNFPVKQNNQFNAPNSFAPAGSMASGFPPPITANIPTDGLIDRLAQDRHPVRRPAGQAGPAFLERPPVDELLHPGPREGLRQRQRRDRDPREPGAELRPLRLRPEALVRVELRLRAAV